MWLQKPMLGMQLDHSDSLNNPVLDLLLNEGHGDRVNDLSGWGNHGTLYGFDFPPTQTSGWNPGADGVALQFDCTDDYINCGNNPNLNITDAFTIEIVIEPHDLTTAQYILQKGNDKYSIILGYQPGYVNFYNGTYQPDATSTQIEVIQDTLNRIVYTKDYNGIDNNWRGYVNGKEKFSLSQDFTNGIDSNPLTIGSFWDGSKKFFRGAIARARILPRAMSAFEVMQTQIDPYGVYLQ